jgi:hypothetical protein
MIHLVRGAAAAFFAALFATAGAAQAQSPAGFGSTRWRDQRAPGARPSVFINAFGGNANPAAIYQSVARPQLELQSQLRTQQQEISRFASESSLERPRPDDRRAPLAGEPRTARLGFGERLEAGHPTYFFRREPYYPRFRLLGRN